MAWPFAAQPFSSPDEQAVMEIPAVRAGGAAGSRLAATIHPNQRAELPRGVNYVLPRHPVQYITTDRMLLPNQAGGVPADPQGSSVLAQQAAMVRAMMGKLGGP